MRFLKTFIRKTIGLFEGRLTAQRFFERLYEISLAGMNYGLGDDIETSGERQAIRYVLLKTGTRSGPLVIFDVGANVGKYTSALLEASGHHAIIVYAFEPSGATYRKLSELVKGFSNVRTFNLGFGDTNGQHELYADQAFSGLASMYKRRLEYRNIAMEMKETVLVRKIDDFCAEHAINQIDFLKLDIEGHELSALKGAKRMLDDGRIRFIQFEFGGCHIDSRTYFRDFFELLDGTHTIYRIVKDGLYPVSRYGESCEVFAGINYLAERREAG